MPWIQIRINIEWGFPCLILHLSTKFGSNPSSRFSIIIICSLNTHAKGKSYNTNFFTFFSQQSYCSIWPKSHLMCRTHISLPLIHNLFNRANRGHVFADIKCNSSCHLLASLRNVCRIMWVWVSHSLLCLYGSHPYTLRLEPDDTEAAQRGDLCTTCF